MSTPETPSNAGVASPAPTPAAASTSAPAAGNPVLDSGKPKGGLGAPGYQPKPPPEPLTGWKSAFEHTGIPRSWLNKRPSLPSRNWCIFLSVVGAVSYIYYDDRQKAKKIRQEYLDKVEYLSKQPLPGTLDEPRRVKVYGARWPEDDESDRALRYFRKYVKPYLVAAAIDYEQVHAPLYGSIARIVRADVLRKRREAHGLQPQEVSLLPHATNPTLAAQQELEGGTVLIGRPSLKEYLSGLHAGWTNGVGEWAWEKEVQEAIKNDGVFDPPIMEDQAVQEVVETPAPSPPVRSSLFGRSTPPPPLAPGSAPTTPSIPEHLHNAPNPLPPQAPILLVPFINRLGFKQVPLMIYDFFTEHKRVQQGAEAAYALITNQTRPFVAPDSGVEHPDTEFGADTEKYYIKAYSRVPETQDKTKEEYYTKLATRLESAREFARGERGLTDEEKASDDRIVTEEDLRAERQKRELRWRGGREGYEIVRPETPVAWDPTWAGWLRVFDVKSNADSNSKA